MKNQKSIFRSAFIIVLVIWMTMIAKGQDHEPEKTRPAQITFITPLGTNGSASAEITNNFSLNLLVGVSGGVHGFELGGLINQVRGNVTGGQFAGLGNFAGGYVSGMQLGGLYNMSYGEVTGAQFAGFGNYHKGRLKGMSLAGLYNISKDYATGAQFSGILNMVNGPLKGFQLSGITNINQGVTRGHQYTGLFNYSRESLYGVQIAGLMNQSSHEMSGFQAAGLLNLHKGSSSGFQLAGLTNIGTRDMKGVQITGLTNIASRDFNGCQIAGLANITAGDMKGSQISGIVNIARNVNGFQLSLINIADTVKKGVPLGLFSIVKDGYRVLEFEVNETYYMNLTYKMGIKRLYNIFTVGFSPVANKSIWSPGIGLGTYRDLSSKVGLSIEGIVSQVNEDEWWTNATNLHNRLRVNASYKATDRLSVYAGLSLNVLVSKVSDEEGNFVGSAIDPPVVFYEEKHNETLVTIYPGINFGLRF